MIIKQVITFFIFFSLCVSQISVQASQQSNFAFGKLLNNPFPVPHDPNLTKDYKINENLFNVSLSKGSFYFYTLFEYSDPPVFGVSRDKIEMLANSYYLEYLGNSLSLKIGSIYSLYTRGLIFNTYQDQTTDFDNSLQGVEISCNLSNNIKIYSVIGTDEYDFRTRPDNQLNDLSFSSKSFFTGSEIELPNDFFLDIQFHHQEHLIDEDVTTDGGQTIIEYYGTLSTIFGHHINENYISFVEDGYSQYSIESNMFGGALQGYAAGVDMYVEYVLNKYTKLQPYTKVGEQVSGSQLYLSLYFDLFDAGITYEFKRYDTPYFIPTISSAPIVYKEATSVLMSRIAHNMSFTDEIGHQFDINYPINDNMFLSMNLSAARRIYGANGIYNNVQISSNDTMDDLHNLGPNMVLPSINQHWEGLSTSSTYEIDEKPSFMSILFMDKDEAVFSYFPYRQFFTGISGSLLDDKFDFSIGCDMFNHIAQWGEGVSSGMTRYMYDMETLDIFNDSYWDDIEQDYALLLQYNHGSDYLEPCPDADNACFLAHQEVAFDNGLDYSLNNDFETFDEIKDLYIEFALDSTAKYLNDQTSYQWHYTYEKAFTIPTYFAWNIGNGDSFLLYLEKQWREKGLNQDRIKRSGVTDNNSSNLSEHNENYISLSYKNKKGWTISLFHNKDVYKGTTYLDGQEYFNEKDKAWNGVDFTIDFKSSYTNSKVIDRLSDILIDNSRLSIFYGSQRGGLVCANGICAQQPEFSEGVKISYTRIF